MKVEYINPFIKSSISILGKATGVIFETGRPSINNTEETFKDIVVRLGVYGGINGQALLCFDEKFAVALVNNMFSNMGDANSLNDLSKSALCELGNMIVGNAATLLYNSGLKVDITTPSILETNDIKDHELFKDSLSIPLQCGYSVVNLKILIKEN